MIIKEYLKFLESRQDGDLWGVIPQSVKELHQLFQENNKKLYLVGQVDSFFCLTKVGVICHGGWDIFQAHSRFCHASSHIAKIGKLSRQRRLLTFTVFSSESVQRNPFIQKWNRMFNGKRWPKKWLIYFA